MAKEPQPACNLDTVKYLMFGYIFLLWTIGGVLLAWGILTIPDAQQVTRFTQQLPPTHHVTLARWVVNGLVAVAVTTGATLFFIGVVDCFANSCENRFLLNLVLAGVIVVFTSLLSVALVLLIQQDEGRHTVERILETESDMQLADGILLAAHYQFDGCCGVKNSDTCPVDYRPHSACSRGSTACQKGCLDQIWYRIVMPKLYVYLAISFASCFILILGFVLLLIFHQKLGSAKVDNAVFEQHLMFN